MTELPKTIPIFPLSNFIIFPKTTVPLNIFEPRYIDMINDSMKSNKLIGMIQPKDSGDSENPPLLHEIGCLGKITSLTETEDGRYLIELKGLIRFQSIKEIKTEKKYRILEIDFKEFSNDLSKHIELKGTSNFFLSSINRFKKNVNNTDGIIDFTDYKASDWTVLEVYGKVNPNTGGSGAYSDPFFMTIY